MLAVQSLLAQETERDPHAYYAYLREHDPVHYDEEAGAYLLTRHEDVGAAYRNPAFSTANYRWQLEPVMGRTILQMDGREHASVRGMMSPSFRGQGLRAWLPLIERTVGELLDDSLRTTVDSLVGRMAKGGEVDLVPRFSHLLPVYVIAEVLGLPRSDHELFYGWYQAQSQFLSNLSRDPRVERRGARALKELREYLAPLVARRRAEPGDDFVSKLARAEVDGRRLTDEEVMTHATHLLNAGSETTDRTVTNLLNHLLTVPERYAAVRDDRSLVPRAIGETLRLTPPSQMNGRVTTEDVEVRGVRIPAGSFVLLVIASANRDERRFANAARFDMYRDDLRHEQAFSGVGEHFAFGFGRHFCLGATVARSELEISLNALLDAFPDMRLAPGFVAEERGLKMRSPRALRVVL
ncbi:cytochrome P450 [Phytohabitans sp. ZYX-F-186]|uniref:Cytochrome P450 n=1 Tax=Phytohabitans maris TaxID=3071409 RepID=A0ABU0ZK90_9ACTN|nr:cytochrome P450 [Phytohabitans sp. ZYX-F-186]MDQ7907459.1 cytochrome P450 [Phytohabitans sp. ZYX-F-186]